MITITVRFFSVLNDFLPHAQRQRQLMMQVTQQRSIKDILESIGVPHVEIDRISLHPEGCTAGSDVDFNYHPENNDTARCPSR